ncbi:Acetyltransferase (GNAT) domain-containing protein [Clostridium sp. DSM 8431]|uniref:GNAT family N-acetyltransferase n=1 Tax=Clostridium sp. DSM 8431 TaxID=1761781 RepID=UPI0008E0DEFA|nr:GNAT family N-acetyltransferase [Clostridium sp. DSM 8431]SFU44531.1 Acetyltransferase (GNAT) domain-containing protein [Clostridium sp. DSM 8431]
MNIRIIKNDISIKEFIELRESVGLNKLKEEQVRKMIKNSIFTILIKDGETLAGMGRLVGDGAYVYYLQNINVKPEYQNSGIGTIIINELLDFIKKDKIEDTEVMVLLMSSKIAEGFYKKFGFRSRPNDKEGSGMILNL